MAKKDQTEQVTGPQEHTYGLKPIETQLLATTQQNAQAIITNEIAMIAAERLAYPITQNTSYRFSEGMTKVTIWEEPASDQPPANPEDTGMVGA